MIQKGHSARAARARTSVTCITTRTVVQPSRFKRPPFIHTFIHSYILTDKWARVHSAEQAQCRTAVHSARRACSLDPHVCTAATWITVSCSQECRFAPFLPPFVPSVGTRTARGFNAKSDCSPDFLFTYSKAHSLWHSQQV